MRVGVVALQGAVAEHQEVLDGLCHQVVDVRTPGDLDGIEGLVLPGGESTTQRLLIDAAGLRGPLIRAIGSGIPTLGTCAGLIALANDGLLDVDVERNGYGPQLFSRATWADDGEMPLILIRAPRIRRTGPGVEVHARYGGEPVWVSEGMVHGTAFHPELTGDRRVHETVFSANRP